MEILTKVTPWLNTFREWILSFSDLIAKSFELDPNNVYLLIIALISLYAGKKIANLVSPTNGGYWIVFSAALFYLIKFVGV